MKRTLTTILCILTLASFSQKINGLYGNIYGNYILFQNDSLVEFSLAFGSCLGPVTFLGMGNYRVSNKKLKIFPSKYTKPTESKYQLVSQRDNSNKTIIKLRIIDLKTKEPLKFANVIYYHDFKKSYWTCADTAGVAVLTLDPLNTDSEIEVSYIGFIPVKIPISFHAESEYVVMLKEGTCDFAERYKMVFKIQQKSDTLFLTKIGKHIRNHSITTFRLIKN